MIFEGPQRRVGRRRSSSRGGRAASGGGGVWGANSGEGRRFRRCAG
ncbi:MAG TPA: hypothetical protein QGI03_02160 [Dehalococcoidia bacterium]|nr:hypothetical protein [Dehalococcoidia bacterium]